MTLRTLIQRSLWFHWRAHLGVVLGAAVGSAALIGALVVGDSVRKSLREKALAGLGHGSFLLHSPDRFFREDLPMKMRVMANSRALGNAFRLYQKTASDLPITIDPDLRDQRMLILEGTTSREDASRRMNRVQIVGIRDFAPVLFPATATTGPNGPRNVILTNVCVVNQKLAQALGVDLGDTLLLRFNKVATLAADSAISPKDGQSATLRLRIHAVTTNGEIASFSLVPTMTTPATVFLPLRELAMAAALPSDEELNFINTWLSPEVVGLKPSPRRPRTKFGATLDEWVRWIKRQLNMPVERDGAPHVQIATSRQLAELSSLLRQAWDFDGAQIARVRVSNGSVILNSERIFIDPPIVRSAVVAETNVQPILTYLVNLLRAGTNTTPYSMVTAAGAPWTPADMRDDEIVLNQWLADDLQAKPGDEIALTYFDPESGARLIERTNTFRVRSIVPMEMPWADRTLMPDFPGIEKAESTSEWDAGFPLVHEIRKKDDDYWKQYRGTSKAFITLAAGKKMWGNRFGELTAIRFPIPTNATSALTPALSPGEREDRPQSRRESTTADSSTASEKPTNEQRLSPLRGGEGQGEGERHTNFAEAYRTALERKILANLKPEELGLRFEPVREQALKAAEQAQDFGQLFLGFSFFLIAAALLLMAMLFQFGLEQRAPEIGTLLALGFTPKRVRRLLLSEGVALSLLGGVLGALGGLAFARVMLHGLTTIWRDAVGASALNFHFTGQTLIIGLFASATVCVVVIWLALRNFVKRPATELLAGEVGEVRSPKSGVHSRGRLMAGAALAGALGLVGWTLAKGDTANAGAFFGAGALVLVAGLSFVSAWLARLVGRPLTPSLSQSDGERDNRRQFPRESGVATASFTLSGLGVRGCARRRKRSLATVAMLACGSFLIVSIGVFRLDANRDATRRSSGTGGFALIGESTMPVVQDLNSQSGREFFALNENDLAGVGFVPFRVRDGDEASCLNLNRAQKPRLMGVRPEMLEGRFSFAKGAEWKTLINTPIQSGAHEIEIPAIGDANSIQWAMHKKVGDTIDYVDERGQPFKVRIVGAVANSILQGSLIIDEAEFVKRFPGESGYRMFLVNVPSNAVSQVSATLSRALQDVGLELTPAAQRLAQFNSVQNTYLGTFQVLGGLGLLLGSVGLGIVVLRNVLERRGELAVLVAVGFRTRVLQRLVLIEHGALLALGLALGIVAAGVAVLPALLSPSSQLPYASLGLTLSSVLVNGAVWTWMATRVALRGNLLEALRNE